MSEAKCWTLTDVANGVWLDRFELAAGDMDLGTSVPWSVSKRVLRGGLGDGVDIIEIRNGALSFSVLPTRGMGIWRGEYAGCALGWDSPVRGPVNPMFVNVLDRETPIARIVPYEDTDDPLPSRAPRRQLADVQLPRTTRRDLGSLDVLLEERRAER